MLHNLRYLPLIVCLMLLSGCAASQSDSSSGDRNLITQEEIRDHGYRTAYDAVESLRSNWLRTRGVDSFRSPTEVQAYYNDSRLPGGVGALRNITTQDLTYIRYYNANEATARWGLDHGQGAIYVSSRPE